jgi:hypothetical protein
VNVKGPGPETLSPETAVGAGVVFGGMLLAATMARPAKVFRAMRAHFIAIEIDGDSGREG